MSGDIVHAHRARRGISQFFGRPSHRFDDHGLFERFSMKSTAPAFIASTAIGISPCPVTMIEGIGGEMLDILRTRSRPLMSGMRMSVTRTALRRLWAISEKAVAVG